MSTLYAGNHAFPTPIEIADDGDPAAMAINGAAIEGLADRTVWLRNQMRRVRMIPVGAAAYSVNSGTVTLSYTYLALVATSVGGAVVKIPLTDLVHSATISAVELIFIPDGGHAALPAVLPAVTLARFQIVVGNAAAAPGVIVTDSYVPDNLAEYENATFKSIMATTSHVVDIEEYVYQVIIEDESGANALAGNTFYAVRVYYS